MGKQYRVAPRGDPADVARGYMVALQKGVELAKTGDPRGVAASQACSFAAIAAWLEAIYEEMAAANKRADQPIVRIEDNDER